ncbi:MAG: hypothetical protein V2A73_10745, partial [Pseudomonadota bacterium]
GCDVAAATPATPEVASRLFLGADAFALEPELRRGVETLLLLDLLEHVEDPLDFLLRCRSAFANARRILVTLPARQELWSNYDEHYGHFRRYDLDSARALLARALMPIREIGYCFHSLYAPALVLALLGRPRPVRIAVPASAPSRHLHRFLASWFRLETYLLPRSLPGTSIYALASFR